MFDLQENLGSFNVSSGCAPAPRTQLLEQVPQGLRATVSRKAARRSRQPAQDSACLPPGSLRTMRDTYQFGGPLTSYLEFAHVPASPSDWSQLSMLVRPHAPRGLLLLAVPQTASSPSLVLFLNHRRFVAQTEGPGPQLQVQSRQRSRTGQWHTVSVRWEKSRIQLMTDGVWAHSQEEPGRQHQRQQGPRPHTLFVGGLPAGGHSPRLPVAISSPEFRGCVKRLRLDGRLLRAPTRMVGVTPCFSGPLEKGLFFTGSGGTVTLDTLGATLPDVALELEVRPQTATGLVFHLGRGQTPPYLELQVLGKQVLLWANDGAGEFSTLVTHPAALCDGRWHRLAVTKGGNVLRLEVDQQSNHTQGPAPATWANTLVPLHLGGLPEPWKRPHYNGCMRNLVLNQVSVTWPRTAGVQGAVGASGCPAT